MAARSLTATPDGIEQINRALTEKEWSRDDLAKHCDCSRQPAVKFCSGKSVSKKLFVSFCKTLELDWEEVSGLKTSDTATEPTSPQTDIDALVEDIRQKVHDDIDYRCGTMRVLDMEQPIGIGDIYTNVNILEKLSKNWRPSREEAEQLSRKQNDEDFDRFMLGKVRCEPIPGVEAVERYSRLIILGKPGAGKTTFMKRLATLCNQGEFQAHRVPVFATLKEFAEALGKSSLRSYIANQWQTCGIKESEAVAHVLGQGRALVLLDGLDEVQEADHDRVLQEIKNFTHQYRDCQFVMTCRIAAREYTFQQFAEVEVADFNQEQIAEFARKWFKTKGVPEKAENFTQCLKANKQIQELATSPLLLTLLCLIFEEREDFLPNRAELYQEGTRLLLKKWDANRKIERDQAYKKLSLKCKEDLLSQLAFETFERGDYFFKQSVLEQHIINYIRNLPGANKDEEFLQLDGESVLKSIEAQHGLLIERARSIYSFSHLTFQEYFSAKQLQNMSPERIHRTLSLCVTEKRYREILLLYFEMAHKADEITLHFKKKIDSLVANEESIQDFLAWANQKSVEISHDSNFNVVRAYYIFFSSFNAVELFNEIASSLSSQLSEISTNIDYLCESYVLPPIDSVMTDIVTDFCLDQVLDNAVSLWIHPELLEKAFENGYFYDLDQLEDLDIDLHENAIKVDVYLNLLLKQTKNICPELRRGLQVLENEVPASDEWLSYKRWWYKYGESWIYKLKTDMLKYRNIGHDWHFTDEQEEKLQQYYGANKLLVDCLNSACYVTKATRQYIENTLLLPMSEIEKYEKPKIN